LSTTGGEEHILRSDGCVDGSGWHYKGLDAVDTSMKPGTADCDVLELCPDLCQKLKKGELEGLSFKFGCKEIKIY
jgi:hypothetical protein